MDPVYGAASYTATVFGRKAQDSLVSVGKEAFMKRFTSSGPKGLEPMSAAEQTDGLPWVDLKVKGGPPSASKAFENAKLQTVNQKMN